MCNKLQVDLELFVAFGQVDTILVSIHQVLVEEHAEEYTKLCTKDNKGEIITTRIQRMGKAMFWHVSVCLSTGGGTYLLAEGGT